MQSMDGAVFRSMMMNAAAAVELHKQQINELNVFPVPDGDTGTNMSLTLSAAATDLRGASVLSLGKAASMVASALLRGARGNSGVITSLLFRGFAKHLKEFDRANGQDFAAALSAGVDTAYKAVMKPAEGTILTVSRVCAEAATAEAEQNSALEHVLEATIQAGHDALRETMNQNPVLKKAGVVDAGGMGFLYILEGMLMSLRGEILSTESGDTGAQAADFAAFSNEDITFTYDTVFIVRKNDPDVDLEPLRTYLGSIGDSLVIGESDEEFKVHVHTDIPGEALTRAQSYGTLELAKIENMRSQAEALAAGRKAQSTDDLEAVEEELERGAAAQADSGVAPAEKRYGIVTVCSGDGIRSVFADLGVDGVVEGGQTMNPSTEDILQQINRTPSEIVFVLPNNKNIIMAAQQAAPLTNKQVIVIPSATVCQGITALLNFDPGAEPDDNVSAMSEAMQGVSTIQITYAARNSDFDGHDIHEGDYLALYNGALLDSRDNLPSLLAEVADKVCAEGKEYITIFYGDGTSASDAAEAEAVFSQHCSNAEISVIDGGQPVYYYLISAE